MATQYPAALDDDVTLPFIDSADEMDESGLEHDVVHLNLSGAVRALEANVGITGSRYILKDSLIADSDFAVAPTDGWTVTRRASGGGVYFAVRAAGVWHELTVA